VIVNLSHLLGRTRRRQELGKDFFLARNDDAVLGEDAHGRGGMVDRSDGVLDLEQASCGHTHGGELSPAPSGRKRTFWVERCGASIVPPSLQRELDRPTESRASRHIAHQQAVWAQEGLTMVQASAVLVCPLFLGEDLIYGFNSESTTTENFQ
jgi:hypothetical protein